MLRALCLLAAVSVSMPAVPLRPAPARALPSGAEGAADLPSATPLEPWLARALEAFGQPRLTRDPAAGEALLPTREAESLIAARLAGQAGEPGALARFQALAAGSTDPLVGRLAHLHLGELLLRAGQPRRAAEALVRAPRAAALSAVWRRQMLEGAALAESGSPATAARLFAAAAEGARLELSGAPVARRPELLEARRTALRWAGWLDARQGDYAAARERWGTALREAGGTWPPADTLRLAVAAAWFAEGEWDSVLAAAGDAAPSGEAERFAVWDYLRGWAHFARGDYAPADSAFARLGAATELPQAWADQALLARGWLAARRGDPRAALESYVRMSGATGEQDALRRYGVAVALLQDGRHAEAARLLEDGPAPDAPPALQDLWALALAHALAGLRQDGPALEALAGFAEGGGEHPLAEAVATLRGDLHFLRGEMEAAARFYNEAAGGDDVPEPLRRRQALAALGAGRWGAAARVLDDLLVKFPGTPRRGEYVFWRGEALYRLGRTEEARALFERAQRMGEDPARCAYALAWCACDEGRYDLALDQFARAARADDGGPLAVDIVLGRAYSLARLDRLRAADQEISALLERMGLEAAAAAAGDSAALAPRARCEEAAKRFIETARLEISSPAGAYALLWAGELLLRAEAPCEAARALREAERHSGVSDTLRARILKARAGALAGCGQAVSAAEDYRRALESGLLSPAERAAAYAALFRAEVLAGNWDGARGAVEALEREGLAAGPDMAAARLELAGALAAAGRPAEALQCYDAWLEAHPRDPAADGIRLRRAALLEAQGDAEGALREYRILGDTAAPETAAGALERAGLLLVRQARDRQALDAFRRRLRFDLPPAEAFATRAHLAAAYARLGERASASNEWEKVANAGPQVPDSLRAEASYQMGRIALEGGETRTAVRALEAAVELGHGPEAAALLEEALRRQAQEPGSPHSRPGGTRR